MKTISYCQVSALRSKEEGITFNFNGIKVWKKIPNDIKSNYVFSKFKKQLSKWLLSFMLLELLIIDYGLINWGCANKT